jgi:hypothetical protein
VHNMEQKIVNWRNELMTIETVLPKNLDELEDHLRANISSLVEHGLSDEEAFLIATKRIGTNDSLTKEFGKVNGNVMWIQRFGWMIIGILLFQILNGIWTLFAKGVSWTTLMYASSTQVASILFVLISACLPVGIWLLVRNTVKKEIDLQQHLKPIVQFAIRKPKFAFSLFAFTLALIPIASFLIPVVTASAIPWEIFGEFQYSVSIYQFAAGFLFPILGVAILAWLNQQLKTTSLS